MPYFSAGETVSVEVLNEEGVFSTSTNNDFVVLDPVYIYSIDTHIYPLDYTIPTFTITGEGFDAGFDYYCVFKRLLTFVNQTEGTRVDSETIRCDLPDNSTEYLSAPKMLQVALGFNPNIDGLQD